MRTGKTGQERALKDRSNVHSPAETPAAERACQPSRQCPSSRRHIAVSPLHTVTWKVTWSQIGLMLCAFAFDALLSEPNLSVGRTSFSGRPFSPRSIPPAAHRGSGG